MARKIFIIACEPSGDRHGAHLVAEILKQDPQAEFMGLGGPEMEAAGVSLLRDMTRISALGWGDVVRQYFTFRKIFYEALGEAREWEPDAVILIDSPAFNLRFAKKLNKRFPVIYYISPQIWAWGGRRIHTIKRTVDKMLVILPFEVSIYEKAGVPCEFVGHPLLDTIEPRPDRETFRKNLEIKPDQTAIGLMPGSRKSEVERIFPLMLESAAEIRRDFPQAVFFVTHAPNIDSGVYDAVMRRFPDLGLRHFYPKKTVPGKTLPGTASLHDLIAALDFALITSGTATLEATLIGTPFFLLYKASWSTYLLGRQLIRVSYLGLANLLSGRRVVPEFIQSKIHPKTIAHEVKVLLENDALYEEMKQGFREVRELLGERGASERAARAVLNFLEERSGRKAEEIRS